MSKDRTQKFVSKDKERRKDVDRPGRHQDPQSTKFLRPLGNERDPSSLVPAFSWDDTTMLRPWFTGSKLKIYYKI